MQLDYAELNTPIGLLGVVVGDKGLCLVEFERDRPGIERFLERRFEAARLTRRPDPGGVVSRLRDYFAGDLGALDSIEVDLHGTDFQRKVWRALRRVPVGRTISYGQLARRIGKPTAVRAVGAANGANPVPLVVPCHRVIGSDGSLTGYGGGMDRKEWLLGHEGAAFRPAIK